MDWFKGKFTGTPLYFMGESWENPWFPVEFPLHHFIDMEFRSLFAG
jgi:hypothetical protein